MVQGVEQKAPARPPTPSILDRGGVHKWAKNENKKPFEEKLHVIAHRDGGARSLPAYSCQTLLRVHSNSI